MKPRDEQDSWLVGLVAVGTLQVERCQRHETALRIHSAGRAASCWDEDRDAEAEELGGKLSRSPSLVMRKLCRTKHGCAWLIRRWEGLQRALETKGPWDDAQKRLALDLLGTPKEFRDDFTPLEGDRRALVAGRIAALEALRAGALDELDEAERAAAEVGLGSDLDRAMMLARRYESACLRRVQWALKQVDEGRKSGTRDVRRPTPCPAPTPAPTPAPARDEAAERGPVRSRR